VNDRFHHLFIQPADFDASLGFYRDVLGWVVTENWGGNGSGRGAMLSGGGINVVLAERDTATGSKDGGDGTRPKVHLDIHDIDARFRMLPKGAHVVVEPASTHWGTRWFVVRDPDGNLIAYSRVLRDAVTLGRQAAKSPSILEGPSNQGRCGGIFSGRSITGEFY